MVSPVVSMRIPDVVHPPIPGETHRYYGNIHLKQIRLPSNSYNNTLRGTTSFPRYSEIDGSIEGELDILDAAAVGNFTRVKELLAPRGSSFVLANEASPSSGLTPLHYAASRGHREIVKWLIEDAGAIVDLEDQTGETALLKASYNGHSSVVAFLLQKQASVTQSDNDGWTALHNASAQGHLIIVKYIIEHSDANIDVKNNKGHTPLMNAASKGNIEIVEYLLHKRANPFVKNSFGEAAYDVAATSQEVYTCGLLEKAERDWWKGKKPLPTPTSLKELGEMPNADQPYDINTFHITVPVVIHENQRSGSAFNISLNLRGQQKYSANNLLKSDIRGPWSLPNGRPSLRDDIRLPEPAASSSMSVVSNATSSKSKETWFWVNDWQIDMSHPNIDSQGWQYAKSFEEIDKNWVPAPSSNGSWVRRRRWVKVMKRCMDLTEGNMLQFVSDSNTDLDYVGRAEAVISKDQDKGKVVNEADQLSRYKEAIEILLSGSKNDTDPQRKQEATSLVNSFMGHAEYLDNRLKGIDTGAVPPSPSFKDIPISPSNPRSSPPTQFRLESPVSRPRSATPNATTITNLDVPSTTSFETFDNPWNNTVQSDDVVGNSSSVFGDSSSMVSPPRPQLGLNTTPAQGATSIGGKWENDEDVHECRRCHKKFSIFNRRHHCRRCGQVVCDKCSTSRVHLPADQVLGPSQGGEASHSSSSQSQYHRVCDSCYESMGHTNASRTRSSSFTSTTIVSGSSNHRRRLSNGSTLAECPVCNISLDGGKSAREEHLKTCFENKNGTSVSGYKYYTNSLKITPSLVKNVPSVSKNS